MRPLLFAFTALVGSSACFDFTLVEETGSGAAGSGASTTASTAGGATTTDGGGGTSQGGASSGMPTTGGGGAGGMTTSQCDALPCGQCVSCIVNFFMGDVADCNALDACVAACNADPVCESACFGMHGDGLFLRSTINAECGAACGGPPPNCGP